MLIEDWRSGATPWSRNGQDACAQHVASVRCRGNRTPQLSGAHHGAARRSV